MALQVNITTLVGSVPYNMNRKSSQVFCSSDGGNVSNRGRFSSTPNEFEKYTPVLFPIQLGKIRPFPCVLLGVAPSKNRAGTCTYGRV